MRLRCWIAAVGCLWFGAVALPAAAQTTSFDCGKASAPVEQVVCNDPVLIGLDGRLGEVFAARRKAVSPAEAATLLSGQRDWLKQRLVTCGIAAHPTAGAERGMAWAAAGCLAEQYRSRLVALGSPEPAPEPSALPEGAIHPICVYEAVGSLIGEDLPKPTAVPLAACSKGTQHIPVQRNAETGVLGSDDGLGGYIGHYAYRTVGSLPDGRMVIIVYENGGGTLDASAVVTLARHAGAGGETLAASVLYAGGDRCSGGIAAAAMTSQAVRVEQHVTPQEFLAELGVPEAKIESLPFCANCCMATLSRQIAPDGKSSPPLSATVDADGIASLSGGPPQSQCLDGLLRKGVTAFPHDYSRDSLATIAQAYVTRCP